MTFDTVEVDGLYSVSYSTTRLGDIATGFSMTITGEEKDVKNKKTVKVDIGDHSGVWGSEEGSVVSYGTSISRSSIGVSAVIMDPIKSFFGKLIMFTTLPKSTFAESLKGAGDFVVLNKLDILNYLNNGLALGNIEKFINGVVKPPDHIDINYNKTSLSPVVKALMGRDGNGSKHATNTINSLEGSFDNGKMMSVGDIFQNFIAPLGLELYWEKDGKYSLEPPRLSQSNPEPIETINRSDIISLDIAADPYNVPDVVIPEIVVRDGLGTNYINLMANSLKAGVMKNLGSKNLKISTYKIPDFLTDNVSAAVSAAKDFTIDSYSGGLPGQSSEETDASIASFYGSHARKSAMYSRKTGSCRMFLAPHITKSYSWYMIDGNMCFVSNIRHEVSRGSCVTILTIAGIQDDSEDLNIENIVLPSDTTEYNKRKELNDAALEEAKKMKIVDSKKTISMSYVKKDKKKMAEIFSDWKDDEEAISGTVIGDATS